MEHTISLKIKSVKSNTCFEDIALETLKMESLRSDLNAQAPQNPIKLFCN